MLANSKVTPIVPVSDLERAATFYAEVLGLAEVVDANSVRGEIVLRTADNGTLQLTRTTMEPGTATLITFEVDSIADVVGALKDKGVVFEDYDLPNFRTQNSIFHDQDGWAAWFEDTEGNTLCLHQKE